MKKISFSLGLVLCFQVLTGQNVCPTWEWTLQLPGIPNSSAAFPISLTTNSSGHLYVSGHLQGTVTLGSATFTNCYQDGFIGKMNSTGSWQWVQKLEKIEVSHSSLGPNNELIIAGSLSDTSILGTDTLVPGPGNNWALALLDSNGNYQWARALNNTTVMDISSDESGNTIVVGDFSYHQNVYFDTITLLPQDSLDGFVAKINHSGSWEWAKLTGVRANAVATNNNGNSWVSGIYQGSTAFDSIVLSPAGLAPNFYIGFLDQNGQWQWVYGTDTITISSLTYDNNHHCVIRAPSRSNNSVEFIGKMNNNGQWQWSLPVKGINTSQVMQNYLTKTDSLGNAYSAYASFGNGLTTIFGSDTLSSTGSYKDLYVSKISSSGQWEWAGTIHGTGIVSPFSIAFHNESNIFVSGQFHGKSFIGLDTLQASSFVAGNFIAKFGHQQPLLLRPMQDSLIHCGDSVRLKSLSNSVAQLKYTWSPGSGMDDSTQARPVVSPLDTTTYTVQAWRDTCSASGQVTIDVDPKAGPANLNFTTSTGDFTYCDNGFSLSAPQGFLNYNWSSGENSRTIQPGHPGTYTVTATDSSGCLVEDSVEIEPLVQLSSPSNFQLCPNIPNDSVQLVATGPANSYLWSTGDTNSAVWVSTPGPYWLTASKGSCSYTDTLQVEILTDTANADFTYTLDSHFVHFAPVSKGVAQAHWTFGDGFSDVVLNPTHRYQVMGQYTVCLATLDVCGYRDTVCKEIDLNSIGMEEYRKEEKLAIYPNPAQNSLSIELPEAGFTAHYIELRDMHGKKVLSLHQEKPVQSHELPELPRGVYFLHWKQATYPTQKLMIE